jgi:hypothetical protein
MNLKIKELVALFFAASSVITCYYLGGKVVARLYPTNELMWSWEKR